MLLDKFAGSPPIHSLAKKSEVFFWFGFWILFAKFFLQSIVIFEIPDEIFRVFLLFGIAFLVIRTGLLILEDECSWMAALGVCLGVFSYFLSGESVLLTTALVITSAYGIDYQKILRCWVLAVSSILAIMMFTYFAALLLGDSIGLTWTNIGGMSSQRGALLFSHPNYCAVVFFAWAMSVWCLKGMSHFLKITAGLLALIIIIFITGSRTSALSLCAFFAIFFIFHFWESRRKVSFGRFIPKLLPFLPLMLCLLTFWISAVWFMSPHFKQEISDLFTGRPALWWAQWNYAGLTLFGHHAYEGTLLIRGDYHVISTVDGMYASLLYNIGIAGFIWILALISKINSFGFRLDATVAAALFAVLILGFTEWHALNAIVFIPLALLSIGVTSQKHDTFRS